MQSVTNRLLQSVQTMAQHLQEQSIWPNKLTTVTRALLHSNGLCTVAYSTSTMIEWIITPIGTACQLATKYFSTLDTLMITCLKHPIVFTIQRTQSLNTGHS
jgi:glycerol kinase